MKKIIPLLKPYLSNFWFVLLLLTISGFVVIFFNQAKTILSTTEQEQKLSPTFSELELIERGIDKSNWQTYSNAQYNFEIKGPETWTIKPNNEEGSLEPIVADGPFGNFLSFQPKDNDNFYAPMSMYIEDNPNNLSITDWMSKKDSRNDSKWQENMFRLDIPTTDESAAFYVPLGNKGIYHYVVKKGDKIFSFDLVDSEADVTNGDAMMDAIVKTLRFK